MFARACSLNRSGRLRLVRLPSRTKTIRHIHRHIYTCSDRLKYIIMSSAWWDIRPHVHASSRSLALDRDGNRTIFHRFQTIYLFIRRNTIGRARLVLLAETVRGLNFVQKLSLGRCTWIPFFTSQSKVGSSIYSMGASVERSLIPPSCSTDWWRMTEREGQREGERERKREREEKSLKR